MRIQKGAGMNASTGIPHAALRYLFTGVAATLCTAVAVGSWLSLALAGSGGMPASAARLRRGR